MYLTPAEYVIAVFGGTTKTGLALGLGRSAVHHWKTRYRGRIPSSQQNKILEVAKSEGLDIMSSDLVCGRKVKKGSLSSKPYKLIQTAS